MIGVGRRHADRPIEIRQRLVGRAGFRLLDAALDLADGLEILADPGAILGSELRLQARDVVAHRVEQAGPSPQRGAPIGRAAALAEQPLEDDARMRLGRERRRRRRPREVVLIDARVAVVALADGLEQIHRQLERRQQRLLADLLARRPDRPSCPGGSRCSRSTSPSPRSGTRRWTSHACRDRRSSAPGC